MKEVIFETQGAKPTLSTTEQPKPASDQILVKSLWTAMNPVDAFVGDMGLLVEKWPAGLGADASGVVVEVGQEAKSKYGFSEGDYVCGCTRIGERQYSTCREFFLMDAQVTMRKPSNLSLAEAATIGAAAQTACFGILEGLDVPVPGSTAAKSGNQGWVVVLGGSGSVGRAAVQLAREAGCKVIASCSKRNMPLVKQIGADAVFDYHLSVEDQVKAIQEATGGAPVNKVFDATSADDPAVAKALFRLAKGTKLFSTTNDWSNIGDFEGGKTHEIHLGQLGKPGASEINKAVEKWNPMLTSLYEAGRLQLMEIQQVGKGGFEDAIKAYKHKADSQKVVVHLQVE